MKALRKADQKPGAVMVEIPIPEIKDNEMLIKVTATALCKSDVDVYEWTPLVASSNYALPFTLGHEFFGEVVKAGSSVKRFKLGDKIAGETHIPCGYCNTCRTGNQHICSNNMGVIGRNVNGCFAEYIVMPEISAVKMPDDMNPAQGSLMEPLGTALHAVTKANVSGKTVAILGCGTIGQMAVEFAKFLGATKVIAADIMQSKLDECKKLGADVIINNREQDWVEVAMKETHNIGVGCVVDFTGNQKVINQAMDALAIGGKCVFVGMIDYPLTFNEFMKKVVYKELNLTGIFGRRMFETWELLAEILATGRINLGHYVAAEIPMSEFEKGVEMFPKVSGRVVMYPDK